MKKRLYYHCLIAIVFTLSLILSAENIWATTFVVHFGGSVGLTYSPASFSANVGDTVQWVGDFSAHPLSSTTIPANAPVWHTASGNSFNYPIAVSGDYHYKCDLHTGAGMIGSFQVSAVHTSQHVRINEGNRLPRIVVNELGEPSVQFALLKTGPVALKIYDLQGRERATVIDGIVQEGSVRVSLSRKIQGAGLYCFKCTGNGIESSGIFIIR